MLDEATSRTRVANFHVFAARSMFLATAFFLALLAGAAAYHLVTSGPGGTAAWIAQLGGTGRDFVVLILALTVGTLALWIAQIRLISRAERKAIMSYTLAKVEKEMDRQDFGLLLPGLMLELEMTLRQAGYTARGWIFPVHKRSMLYGCSIAKSVVDTVSVRERSAAASKLSKLPLVSIAHSH